MMNDTLDLLYSPFPILIHIFNVDSLLFPPHRHWPRTKESQWCCVCLRCKKKEWNLIMSCLAVLMCQSLITDQRILDFQPYNKKRKNSHMIYNLNSFPTWIISNSWLIFVLTTFDSIQTSFSLLVLSFGWMEKKKFLTLFVPRKMDQSVLGKLLLVFARQMKE